MTPEDRAIWGRVSIRFAILASEYALKLDTLSGLAIALPHLSGAQDMIDYSVFLCTRGRLDSRLQGFFSADAIDCRGRPLLGTQIQLGKHVQELARDLELLREELEVPNGEHS